MRALEHIRKDPKCRISLKRQKPQEPSSTALRFYHIDLTTAPLYLKDAFIAPGVSALPLLLVVAIFKPFRDLYGIYSGDATPWISLLASHSARDAIAIEGLINGFEFGGIAQ